MTMSNEEMVQYVTIIENGDAVKDFFSKQQVEQWLYEFCLTQLGMKPAENREGGGVRLLNTTDDNALD